MSDAHLIKGVVVMKTEKDLATELGVKREVLKELRTEGLEGWQKQGNSIVWSEEGEHEVRNAIQKALLIEEMSEPLPEHKVEEFVITKLPVNTRLVICGDVYVRVKSNKNFRKGMTVRARPPAVSDSRCWVMVGRCPRWWGRY